MLSFWDCNTNKNLFTLSPHMAPATAITFSPINDTLALSVGLDKRLVCCDTKARKQIMMIQCEAPLTSADFDQDGVNLAVGSSRGKILVYDLRKPKAPLHNIAAHNSTVTSVLFKPKPSGPSLSGSADSMESKVEEGNSNVEKRIARLESKIEASCESIKAKIDAAPKNNKNVVKPKCPICFEEMSSKIAQCISGHFLCWPCKEKMGDKDCAFCDQPVNGRCYGMEAYLRTIFG